MGVTGHLQVRGERGSRRYLALWVDGDGVKRTRTLGRAHVKDSGRRTPRGAVVWRTADGPCPEGFLTPREAEEQLEVLLEAEQLKAPGRPARAVSYGGAVDAWLAYLRDEKRRKGSTLEDARAVVRRHLLPHFGADRPIAAITPVDVERLRRLLLRAHAPRTAQKVLVLANGVFVLAVRREWIERNPAANVERVQILDDGRFSILEPAEFERVVAAVVAGGSVRRDSMSRLSPSERVMFGALLSVLFYAGLRLGELVDLPWRNVDHGRKLIRVESGFTHGVRELPKSNKVRATPLVPVVAERLLALRARERFIADHDYVGCTAIGRRLLPQTVWAVFYDGLHRAGYGHLRAEADAHGNEQTPMVLHDLRHSYCSWAVNIWPITKVKEFAGHASLTTTQRYVHHVTKAEDADLAGAYLEQLGA